MAAINLNAEDERVIVAALEGYARHLGARRAKLEQDATDVAPLTGVLNNLARDQERSARIARVIREWRASADRTS